MRTFGSIALFLAPGGFLPPFALADTGDPTSPAGGDTTEPTSAPAPSPPTATTDGGGGSGSTCGWMSEVSLLPEFSLPEPCCDVALEWLGCLRADGGQTCLPCFSGEVPPVPSDCDDLAALLCRYAGCCPKCSARGEGVVNCFNAHGGQGPDGERCAIDCGEIDDGSGGGAGSGARAIGAGCAAAAASAAAVVGLA